jgi:prepilin-type N-terminal cleavage/methylation domain-containing protein
MNTRLRKRSGFTLIELMIVIAIIAILAAILVPNLIRARSRSQLTGCTTNLKNIATSVEMYNVDYNGRYPTAMSLLTPNYLKSIPICPVAGSDSYSGGYTSTVLPDEFEVFCQGGFHAGFTPTDYPRYDAAHGLIER